MRYIDNDGFEICGFDLSFPEYNPNTYNAEPIRVAAYNSNGCAYKYEMIIDGTSEEESMDYRPCFLLDDYDDGDVGPYTDYETVKNILESEFRPKFSDALKSEIRRFKMQCPAEIFEKIVGSILETFLEIPLRDWCEYFESKKPKPVLESVLELSGLFQLDEHFDRMNVKPLTIQMLIDELSKQEDKTLPVVIRNIATNKCSRLCDCDIKVVKK